MRKIKDYLELKGIPTINDREWNYYFTVNELVKLTPEMKFNGDYNKYYYKIGVVKQCWTDLHCIYGASYLCRVDFDGDLVDVSCMFLYTKKNFYEGDKRN